MNREPTIKVRPYRLTDYKAWNDYVTGHPEGSIFHLIQWRNVVVQTFQHQAYYLVAEAGKTPLQELHIWAPYGFCVPHFGQFILGPFRFNI